VLVALRLLRLARRSVALAVLGSACGLVATAADLALVLLLKTFVDLGIAPATQVAAFARLVAAAMAVALVREAAAYVAARLERQATVDLVADLRERLFAHFHGLSLDFFSRHAPGELTARLFHDVDGAARLAGSLVAAAFQSPLRIVALAALLWSLDRSLALVAVGVLVPGLVVTRLLSRRLRSGFAAVYESVARLYERAQESLGAAETVKSLGREAVEVEDFAARSRSVAVQEKALYGLEALESPVGQALRLLALVALVGLGGRAVAAGQLGAGALAAALVAAYALLDALQSLAVLYASAQAGVAAAARVFAVFDEAPLVAPSASGRRATFRAALRFEEVGFAYPGRTPVVAGLSLALRPGEHVALVGASGSGKTTLLRLALRLYDPASGRVTLDGIDLRELDLAALRQLFAVVPQDVVLLDRSLRDNVAWVRPAAAPEEIDAALRQAGVTAFAARLPEALDTVVGSRGAALSAGERQRVALARALLRDAPILLLDEATSALDLETERHVRSALEAFARGRCVVSITHDLAALATADRILVLESGVVAEEGTHAALLAAGGAYARLVGVAASASSVVATAEASGRKASS
jgi:ABC-type multidrug transport system fused ATPase/permease subunit